MVLVASGRERRRRRAFVAALFALADGDAATAVALPNDLSAGAAADVDADGLVVKLFRQEAASLVRLARMFTDDRSAAEDLVQEAFIRLHRSAKRIRDAERAPAYLRSIVLNLARDHNRRGLMSLRHQERAVPPPEGDPAGDDVVASDEQQRVIDALRLLPPRQRDCLVLRFYYDHTERETGEALGISPNSVKTHVRRGLESLALRLEER